MTTPTPGAFASGAGLLAVVSNVTGARASALAALAVVAPPSTRSAYLSGAALEVVYARNPVNVPKTSSIAAEIVYSTALPYQDRSLAWAMVLDGHTMYVLDLGQQGTFVYDTETSSWCSFKTQNSVGWNLRNGTVWNTGAPRVVGGDSTGPYIWELDPEALFDDGFRDIPHAATAAIMLRSRVYVSMSELRIAASAGLLDDTTGAAYMQLTYSDDGGQTYQGPFVVQLVVGTTPDGQQDIRFSSLGSFMAPGRVMQIADVGGVLRLDGIDAMLDNYDETTAPESET